MNPVQRLLNRVFTIVTWQPLLTISFAVLLAVLSIAYTVHNLGFETSQRDLLSRHNRLVKLAEQIDQFDNLDGFVVAIENHNTQRSLAFLHALVRKLRADHRNFKNVFYRVDPKSLRKWALLYMDPKELHHLANTLQKHHDFLDDLTQAPGLTNFFKFVNKEMTKSMVSDLFTGFLKNNSSQSNKNPVDLTFLINSLKSMNVYLEGQPYQSPWGSFFSKKVQDFDSQGYFWTENDHYLLFFVVPSKENGNGFGHAQSALTALRKTIVQVQKQFPGMQAGVTGQKALNDDEMSLAMRDMSLATAISMVGLTLLLIIFWGTFRLPICEMIELTVSLSLTFGLTTLVVGHLNILSIVFAPLLLGLGIDYGIHWLARYQEEEQAQGRTKREAIRNSMINLGPGIILAGFTAALSFFPLILTGFKGLVELGIICSMGMVTTTITTTSLLPALVMQFAKFKRKTNAVANVSPQPEARPLLGLNNRRAAIILIPAVLFLAASAILAPGVTFDLNMLHLQSPDAQSVIWEKKLLSDSKRSSMYGALLVNTLQEAKAESKALKALPTVSKVQNIATMLPDDQQQKLAILANLKPLLPSVIKVATRTTPVDSAELNNILSSIAFKMLGSNASNWGNRTPLESQMRQVHNLISQIRQHLTSLPKPALQNALQGFRKHFLLDLNDKLNLLQENVDNTQPMRLTDLPHSVRERFISKNHHYLIRIYPEHDIWKPQNLGRFVHDIRSVNPNVVGDPVTLYIFTRQFRDACIKASIYAVIFIVVLLLLTFRNVTHALLAMLPLVIGTIWTAGLMRCFGVELNLANSLFLPLIVGAGVEYGIIILQRWKQDTRMHNVVLPMSTGKGVVLAGLTTTVGFSSLMISSHQGIHSLGLLATIGSLSVVAAAVLFLPAVLQALCSLSEKTPYKLFSPYRSKKKSSIFFRENER